MLKKLNYHKMRLCKTRLLRKTGFLLAKEYLERNEIALLQGCHCEELSLPATWQSVVFTDSSDALGMTCINYEYYNIDTSSDFKSFRRKAVLIGRTQ